MKKLLTVTTCFIVLMSFSFQQDNNKIFKQLQALEGTWIMKGKNGFTTGEQWTKMNDGYLQGKGFFIKGKDTVVSETVQLRLGKNDISYVSTVKNQNNHLPVTFILTSADVNMFVFENAKHDFPKRIVYQFTSDKSIHAWVDAGKDAVAEKQDFYYEKVK
jgi:hypothetical protein